MAAATDCSAEVGEAAKNDIIAGLIWAKGLVKYGDCNGEGMNPWAVGGNATYPEFCKWVDTNVNFCKLFDHVFCNPDNVFLSFYSIGHNINPLEKKKR